MLKILDGADPRQFPRYAALLRKNPLFRDWIESGQARDARREVRQREWLATRR